MTGGVALAAVLTVAGGAGTVAPAGTGTAIGLIGTEAVTFAGARRAAERLSREQRGQDLIEYGGILILVAAIIAALLATGIVGDVASFVHTAVNNIIGSSAVSNSSKTG